ncbi:hypothetical protein [Polyangium jinanense]|nr:hypothetical protein [Polyangium jinanense]
MRPLAPLGAALDAFGAVELDGAVLAALPARKARVARLACE